MWYDTIQPLQIDIYEYKIPRRFYMFMYIYISTLTADVNLCRPIARKLCAVIHSLHSYRYRQPKCFANFAFKPAGEIKGTRFLS
jgi:hypothetical protein